jgi:hypothetical protein
MLGMSHIYYTVETLNGAILGSYTGPVTKVA